MIMRKFYNVLVNLLYEWFSVVTAALVFIALIYIFLFRITGISGDSMLPTLKDGDRIVISSASSEYEYKDVIIIAQPGVLNEPLVKRVIATDGQWVSVDYENGLVYVGNSQDSMIALNEDYILEAATVRNFDDINEYPVQVPDGMLFVMGDNRNDSTDSRSYMVGFIDKRYVLGKALYRVWSENGGFDSSSYLING